MNNILKILNDEKMKELNSPTYNAYMQVLESQNKKSYIYFKTSKRNGVLVIICKDEDDFKYILKNNNIKYKCKRYIVNEDTKLKAYILNVKNKHIPLNLEEIMTPIYNKLILTGCRNLDEDCLSFHKILAITFAATNKEIDPFAIFNEEQEKISM